MPMIFDRKSAVYELSATIEKHCDLDKWILSVGCGLARLRLCFNQTYAHYPLTSALLWLLGAPPPRWDSSPLQAEDNQPSPHLLPGLSPGLKIVAGLQKEQLLACFHKYIAMVAHSTHRVVSSLVFSCVESKRGREQQSKL